ncbi:hypothetical protein ACGFNU_21135 [Spirillospora sp. NPDC048911]|uniref:hypothetical protein n=1 Tax=Spirillospora sp. NPDC048911 TaxID=3364527 RepID=UPI003722A9B0
MAAMTDTAVHANQIWAATGKSTLGLSVQVDRIDDNWAECTILTNRDFHQRHIDRCQDDHCLDDPECGVRDRRGKAMRISLGCFTPVGQMYRPIDCAR